MKVPAELRYTSEHEWVQNDGGTVTVGLTDFAQDALGDIVYVQLPEVGARVAAGDAFGEVESTKSVSEIYAPVAGEVVDLNTAVVADPALINSDPYGKGWLLRIRLTDPAEVDGLLDADGYTVLTNG